MEALAFEALSIFYIIMILNLIFWMGTLPFLKKLLRFPTTFSDDSNLAATFILGFSFLGILAYAIFWVYYANAHIGKILSFAALAIGIWKMSHLGKWFKISSPSFRFFVCCIVGLTVLYAAILYIVPVSGLDKFPEEIRFRPMPGDNELQKILGSRLRSGAPLEPFYGEWQASDRPPLLTGFYLLFSWNNEPIFYRALAFSIQMMWWPAVSLFAAAMGFRRKVVAIALVGLSLNGFVLLNSLFTWPKMQSAAYLIFGLTAFSPMLKDFSRRSRGILAGCVLR